MLDAEADIEVLFSHISKQEGVNKREIEIIVVDDGSMDNTLSEVNRHNHLLEKFHSVRIITHTSRQGLVITRVDGVSAAAGKFITFIDKKGRPDKDYLFNFLSKKRNIIIGNVYVDKTRSMWGRVLALIRKRVYYPYFNHTFNDVDLDYESYSKFKNKGGGGCMFVRRDYYLKVAKTMPTGVHVNDDSLFVQNLSKIEPILKTSDAKLEYINRTGLWENIAHLYNRGLKFVDFYAKPGSRFFIPIVGLVVFVIVNLVIILTLPIILAYEYCVLVVILLLSALYLSEDTLDFIATVAILPIAIISFSCGILKGLGLKLLGKY